MHRSVSLRSGHRINHLSLSLLITIGIPHLLPIKAKVYQKIDLCNRYNQEIKRLTHMVTECGCRGRQPRVRFYKPKRFAKSFQQQVDIRFVTSSPLFVALVFIGSSFAP